MTATAQQTLSQESVQARSDLMARLRKVHDGIPADRLPHWIVVEPDEADPSGRWTTQLWVAFPEGKPTGVSATAATIDELRSLLPEGLTRITGGEEDLPGVVETWL
jgi:hypothetical protein